MNCLIENTVFSGLVMACRLATWPTRISPSLVKATTEGVRRLPSWLGMTVGLPPSITATTELVVPRSIPITLLMVSSVRAPEPDPWLGPTAAAPPWGHGSSQAALISIRFPIDCWVFGMWTSRTPFLKVALIFSVSTPGGSATLREKPPAHRSL